jgi:hypothetical protein
LIARGASNAEACRIVGVNPRTGKRWRLAAVAAELNDRPRKTPRWDTPAARLAASLGEDSRSEPSR